MTLNRSRLIPIFEKTWSRDML